MIVKRQGIYFGLLLLGIALAAWFIQDHLFLNWDVGYLLNAAQRMSKGGTYTRDFFTPNPPLILYLYYPPLYWSQTLGLSLVLALRLYFFLLAGLSLLLCGFFTRILFGREDKATLFTRAVFVLALALIFLVLPSYDFGQREHLLLILTLPYLLLVACRLQGAAVNRRTGLVVGLMAGLGLALKPQFYVLPLLIELYYLYTQKKYLAWLRAETLAIVGVLGAYLVLVFLFYPDFITLVLPFVLRNFYGSVAESWSRLLLNHLVLFCCLPLFLHGLLYPKNPYQPLSSILAIAVSGFLCAYLAQHTTFYYHLLPAFSLAILLQVLLFTIFASQPVYSRRDYVAASVTGLLGFAFLFYQVRPVWLTLLFSTVFFFCFFGCLFAFLLSAAPQRLGARRILGSVFLILGTGFLCFYLAQRTRGWSLHQTLLTILVLLSLFGLLAPRKRGGVGMNILTAALGMLIFAYPAFFPYCLYWKAQAYKEKVLNKLIVFMHDHPPQRSFYIFSLNGSFGAPLMAETGSRLVQRFDCLWPVEGFVRRAETGAALQKDKNLFLEMIAEDLRLRRPDLIFVDQRDLKMLKWDPRFNYLTFFSQNPHFRHEWKAYHYLTTLKDDFGYELAVYQRRKL